MSDLIYCTDGELCEHRCTDTRLCEGINPVKLTKQIIVSFEAKVKELEASRKAYSEKAVARLHKIEELQAVVDRLAYEPQASMRHYQVIAQQYATKEDNDK